MNIIVLMAGSSDVLREAGYAFPKPLVEIAGRPVVQHVIERLLPLLQERDRLIVLVRHDENVKYHIGAVVKLLAPGSRVIEVRGTTSGAACTALLAVDCLAPEEPLIVVNGDQIIDADLCPVVRGFKAQELHGGIVVFNDVHPRWSFVKCDSTGMVIEAAEKRPISNIATAGFYYFRVADDFVRSAEVMILKNAEVGGNFYVCPCYNEMILRNQQIGTHLIGKGRYFSLANIQGIERFEMHLSHSQS